MTLTSPSLDRPPKPEGTSVSSATLRWIAFAKLYRATWHQLTVKGAITNAHSLILFNNDDRVGSIISGLPEHIAIKQLASKPEGIVQDEANVAFLLQKVE